MEWNIKCGYKQEKIAIPCNTKCGHYTAICDCKTGTTRSPEELNGNVNDECDRRKKSL